MTTPETTGECRLHSDELAAVRRSLIVAEFAVDGTLLDASPKFLRLFGYEFEELIGQPLSVMLDDRGAEADTYETSWAGIRRGETHQSVGTYRDKAGKAIWVDFTFTPIRNASGQCYRVVAVGTDVTQQKVEAAEQNEQIAAIRKSMAVCEFDLDGTILDANENFLSAFGYKLAEVKGRHHQIFVTPPFAMSVEYASFWRSLRNGLFQAARYKRVGKGGRDVWIEASYNPILDIHGNPYKIVKFATDITARKQEEDARQAEIAYTASHDALTGLSNRAAMRECLASLLAGLQEGHVVTAILVDLDGFKGVNDTLGHGAGDELLIDVARRISCVVDAGDHVARWGGDEFAICLERDADDETVERLCADILAVIDQPFVASGSTVTISGSLGVAQTDQRQTSVDDLLRDADTALYYVKDNGRRNYRIFDCELLKEMDHRRRLETDLGKAIRNNQLSVIYQPIVDVRSDEMVGVETLCRWNHPLLGSIPPSVFIPIAERIGLIADLGFLVIEQAMSDFADWPEHFVVSINLSPKQIESRDFVERLDALIENLHLPSSRIEFEVTETVLLDSASDSLQVLNALRVRGFKIALDDFGTGYSSLSYLKLFPFDRVKIDRSFICDISVNPQSSAIVAAVINLAHALDMEVTAEGIETFEQYQLIGSAGCDAAQGYFLGRCVTPSEINRLNTKTYAAF